MNQKWKFSLVQYSSWNSVAPQFLFDSLQSLSYYLTRWRTRCVWCGRAVTIYIGTPQFALCVAESRIIVGWKLNTPGCSYRNSYHSAKQTKSNDKIKQLPGILVKKSFQINKENISIQHRYLDFGTSLEIVGLLCSYYTLGHSNIWLCGSLFVIPLFGHFRGAKKGTNSNFTNNRCQNLINYFWYLINRKSIIVKFIYGYIHWFVTLKFIVQLSDF